MKCSEPNCTRKAYAGRSYTTCEPCHRNALLRARRRGLAPSQLGRGCMTPGCEGPDYCGGFCEPCYLRSRRTDPTAPKCTVSGCARPRFRRRDGLCVACMIYVRRHGVLPVRVDATTVSMGALPADWSVLLLRVKEGAS